MKRYHNNFILRVSHQKGSGTSMTKFGSTVLKIPKTRHVHCLIYHGQTHLAKHLSHNHHLLQHLNNVQQDHKHSLFNHLDHHQNLQKNVENAVKWDTTGGRVNNNYKLFNGFSKSHNIHT